MTSSTHTSTSYHIIQSHTIIIGNPRYTTIYCNAYRVMFVFCKHSLTQWLDSVLLDTRITQKQEILCSLEMYTGHCRKLVENELLLEETVLYSREGGWRKKGCVWDRTGREGDTINDIIHRVWLHTVGRECYCTRWCCVHTKCLAAHTKECVHLTAGRYKLCCAILGNWLARSSQEYWLCLPLQVWAVSSEPLLVSETQPVHTYKTPTHAAELHNIPSVLSACCD